MDFDQQVYGGLQTTDPALIALQLSILAPQAYKANVSDTNHVRPADAGLQGGPERQRVRDLRDRLQVGRPQSERRADGRVEPAGALGRDGQAGGHPERRSRAEDASRSAASPRTSASYDTEIKNFQAQVTNGSVGVIRGYLANAEKVRVRGAEFDGAARVGSHSRSTGPRAYTDGKYVTFTDAPPPLEDTGGPQFEDISGIHPAWHLEVGALARRRVRPARDGLRPVGSLLRRARRQLPIVVLVERHATPGIWSSTDTRLLNARVGFRAAEGWTISLWSRNLLNQDYFELLTAAPGNTGLFVGQPGDRRTIGVTLRVALKARK